MDVIDSGDRSRRARRVESVAQATVALADDAQPLDPRFAALSRNAASEGTVLLANDGALPLGREGLVAVFGRTQIDYFAVGYGSGGDVKAPYVWNLLDALRDAGVAVDDEVAATYSQWSAANPPDEGDWGTWPLAFDEMPVTEAFVRSAASRTNTAVVVIGRSAGEARDSELAPGSYYLTDDETALLDRVTAAFPRVVVVLDIGCVMDLSWLEAYGSRISAVLVAWLGGMEGARAVADVLTGTTPPSGKLTDSIARAYEDYPSSANYGDELVNVYAEDVFVGYRYFETFCPEKVLFPFGFGLGYTTFSVDVVSVTAEADRLVLEVAVTNSGAVHSGKETVQVYVGAPDGALSQPARQLVAFAKTPSLAPGERSTLRLEVGYDDLASYDDSGVTGHPFAWVLEPGDYRFYVGTDVRSARRAHHVTMPAIRVVRQRQQVAAPDPRHPFSRITIARDASGAATIASEPVPTASVDRRARLLAEMPDEIAPTGDRGMKLDEVAAGTHTLQEFVAQLSPQELADLTRGEGSMNSPLGVPGNAGALGGVTEELRAKGVPALTTTDGPSGIRVAAYASLIPSGTALAATWNLDLVRELAVMQGREMKAKGSDILLGPGMNIRRNPLCGRNFEYFSEDPFVSGRMAAAVVAGIQCEGVAACPKHFAANNQEMNRTLNDSRVSERALREIYLRPFQICIAEARPLALMTSYNKINGVWAHYNRDLVTTILRGEWRFSGLVMTDWWMEPGVDPDCPDVWDSAYRVRAQVDVLMPGGIKTADGPSDQLDDAILRSLERPAGITLAELQRSAMNVLGVLLRLRAFSGD